MIHYSLFFTILSLKVLNKDPDAIFRFRRYHTKPFLKFTAVEDVVLLILINHLRELLHDGDEQAEDMQHPGWDNLYFGFFIHLFEINPIQSRVVSFSLVVGTCHTWLNASGVFPSIAVALAMRAVRLFFSTSFMIISWSCFRISPFRLGGCMGASSVMYWN